MWVGEGEERGRGEENRGEKKKKENILHKKNPEMYGMVTFIYLKL